MPDETLQPGQWTAARANAWWAGRPWVCGVNYVTSSAVNFLEMWHSDTFDPETMARELRWAGKLGFNAIRTNLHYLVWQHDRDGLMARIDRVLGIATSEGLQTVLCLFDDCGFGGAEPVYGRQPDPVPGVHNGRAVANPGRLAVMNRGQWPRFEAYLRDLVSTFGRDDRILFWDLYNEPGNRMVFTPTGCRQDDAALVPHSHALLKMAFAWARDEAPSQPLTVAPWITPLPGTDAAPYATDFERDAIAMSDIVTFHAYAPARYVATLIDRLSALGRPLLSTEWMARMVDSRIGDQLPLYHARNVGAFQWGLAQGRSQTHLPWPEEILRQHGGGFHRDGWFQDLLYSNGQPFDAEEIATIRRLTAEARP